MKFLYLGAHIWKYPGVLGPNFIEVFDQVAICWVGLYLDKEVGDDSFMWN